MEKMEREIEMYKAGNSFRVIIFRDEVNGFPCYNAILNLENYGLWLDMFGTDTTKEDFLDLVEANLDEYKDFYYDEMIENGDLTEEGREDMILKGM